MERGVKLTLTVIAGAGVGRSWEVPCGVVQRVGATGEADVVLEGDAWLAGAHFALYWVGEECRVRDLSTGRGTWVNGRGVQDEVLRTGDVVQCGGTQLRVEYGVVEGTVGVGAEEEPKARALATLRGLPEKLYAVLDAARDPEILPLLRRSGYRYECLYSGWAREVYGDVAPYLVQLRKDGRLLEQLVEQGWGKGWGMYSSSRLSFPRVLKFWRRRVSMDAIVLGRVIVRFFDPEVMDVLMKSAAEHDSFILEGTIDLVGYEDLDENCVIHKFQGINREAQRVELSKRAIVALQRNSLQKFKQKMTKYLCDFAKDVLHWHMLELENFIDRVIETAQVYGIDTEYDVQRFLEYQIECGEGFEASQPVVAIFQNTALSGTRKMDRIDEWALTSGEPNG